MSYVAGLLFAVALPVGAAEFVNVAAIAGLTHSFPNGGDESKTWIVETTGSGAAWIDYDNDGLLDAFLVSGPGARSRLYQNQGDNKFTDVTEQTLPELEGWGQGVCAGDIDNDGFTDLFVTYWGRNRLLRNAQGGRFEDATKVAGLEQFRTRYNTGCAFLDYDRDGDLDLFGANYLKFDFETTPRPGENPYCYYRNLGDGRFEDVSESSGPGILELHAARGAAFADADSNGRVDVLVNNQNEPPSLLTTEVAKANWIILHLEETDSNRSAIGAKVRLTADGRTQSAEVRGGGSYLSQNSLRLRFGIADANSASAEITWPNGRSQSADNLRANEIHHVRKNTAE